LEIKSNLGRKNTVHTQNNTWGCTSKDGKKKVRGEEGGGRRQKFCQKGNGRALLSAGKTDPQLKERAQRRRKDSKAVKGKGKRWRAN